MSIGYIFNGKSMPGSCGNSNENPCECSFAEKLKCLVAIRTAIEKEICFTERDMGKFVRRRRFRK